MNSFKTILALLQLTLITSCNLPKDPNESWERAIEAGNIEVGIVENLPFISFKNNRAQGSEVQLIEKFAKHHNLTITFHKGSESVLTEKLRKYELNILIGGFDKKTIWKKKVGISLPYDEKHVFLVPKGENELLYHLEQYLENRRK